MSSIYARAQIVVMDKQENLCKVMAPDNTPTGM